MLKHRLGTVYDFRGASSHPYHPSPDDFKKPGLSPILEIPVTENPLYRQTPIGAGFLNTHGPEETLRAIGMVDQPLTILIIHPWEFINLWDKFPHLPKWIRRGCRENLSALSELIDGLRGEGYGFLDLEKVCDGLAKTDSECVALH